MVVLNDKDPRDEDSYEFVNKFLVRRRKDATYLEVLELNFKQGKLEEGPSVGQYNQVKKINIEQFL